MRNFKFSRGYFLFSSEERENSSDLSFYSSEVSFDSSEVSFDCSEVFFLLLLSFAPKDQKTILDRGGITR